jgi:hypothetical protein
MHDCPRCGVPLHGYEQRCPSCDTPQVVTSKKWGFLDPVPQAKVNPAPIIVALLLVVLSLALLAKTTWVGQLLTRGPEPEDPMAKLTCTDARKIIQDKLTEGLAQVGAKGRFTWTSNGNPADINSTEAIQLSVATRLSNPKVHESIVTPVKDYMDKAQVSVLTMTDSASHATWTYTLGVTPSAPQPGDE